MEREAGSVARPEFVYYIRRDGLIKIGHAFDLRARMMKLRPDALLALEAGSFQLEAQRHRQFAVYRADVPDGGREWFTPSPAIVAHISALTEKQPPPPLALVLSAPSLGYAHCSFGHALTGANAAPAKAGGQTCRSCAGARTMRGQAARKDVVWDLERLRAEADRRYVEIMGGAA